MQPSSGKLVTQQSREEAMPLLSRTAVHTTLYALTVLAIFCANPSAAEPTTIALLLHQPISPVTSLMQVRRCPSHERAACQRNLRECKRINAPGCQKGYRECIEECHAGD